MQVRRYDYMAQFGDQLPKLVAEIDRMLRDGNYVLSNEVRQFEEAFGAYLDVAHVYGVNSGTDALIVGLRALGIGPGDEVVTQANTFNATVAAICLVGATPKLVDVDSETFLLDLDILAQSVTSKTRAVIPVHLYGKPTPMGRIMDLSAKLDFAVIEDAAQAHGARTGDRRVGTIGQIGCFSFHPSKNLAAAGDAGALVSGHAKIAEKVECLRALGQSGQNHHVTIGYNTKLDAIQALILKEKLSRLDAWNEDRRRLAARYRHRLAEAPVQFQRVDSGEEHVFHLLQVRTDRRDALFQHLRSADIDCVIRYPTPIHLQPAFADYGWKCGQFPVAEQLANELLCLPIRPDMSLAEVDYVSDQVLSFYLGSGP